MMGAALNLNHKSDANYTKTAAQQYDVITAENACKWSAMRPTYEDFKLDDCIKHLNFAMTHKQKFRGHNLVWGAHNPDWLTNFSGTADELEDIMEEHIRTVMENVPLLAGDKNKALFAWDVVNEAITSFEETDLYKSNVWYDNIPDYVEKAFAYAQKVDSSVLAFYNDYNVVSEDK